MKKKNQKTKKRPAYEFQENTGLIWPSSMDRPVAGMSREAFEYAERGPTEEERKTGLLLTACANAFVRAGKELGVDPTELANKIDLTALLRQTALKRKVAQP